MPGTLQLRSISGVNLLSCVHCLIEVSEAFDSELRSHSGSQESLSSSRPRKATHAMFSELSSRSGLTLRLKSHFCSLECTLILNCNLQRLGPCVICPISQGLLCLRALFVVAEPMSCFPRDWIISRIVHHYMSVSSGADQFKYSAFLASRPTRRSVSVFCSNARQA